MDMHSQHRQQSRAYNHRALYRQFKHPFSLTEVYIDEPASSQMQKCLVKIALQQIGLTIPPNVLARVDKVIK
jgi:hypothetical protein